MAERKLYQQEISHGQEKDVRPWHAEFLSGCYMDKLMRTVDGGLVSIDQTELMR